MSEIARLYSYKVLLYRLGAMAAADIQAELDISPATIKSDITKLWTPGDTCVMDCAAFL